jgi:hypothetical protein
MNQSRGHAYGVCWSKLGNFDSTYLVPDQYDNLTVDKDDPASTRGNPKQKIKGYDSGKATDIGACMSHCVSNMGTEKSGFMAYNGGNKGEQGRCYCGSEKKGTYIANDKKKYDDAIKANSPYAQYLVIGNDAKKGNTNCNLTR